MESIGYKEDEAEPEYRNVQEAIDDIFGHEEDLLGDIDICSSPTTYSNPRR